MGSSQDDAGAGAGQSKAQDAVAFYDWDTGMQQLPLTFDYYEARPTALQPTGGHVRGGR